MIFQIGAFIMGLIFGSFLNSLEYRIGHKKTLKGRSFCPKCKQKINWQDNIPLLSFVLLKGSCRFCKNKISTQYPVIELTTGLAFLLAANITNFGDLLLNFFLQSGRFPFLEIILFIILATIFFIMIIVALHDAKEKLVISLYVYLGTLLAITYNILIILDNNQSLYSIAPYLLSALIPAFLFWLASKLSNETIMGYGDSEIALMNGALLGWPLILISYYFAFISGSIWGIFLIIKKGAKMKSEVPLGPFLIAGTFFSLIFGEQIIAWYGKIFLGI